MKLLMCLLSIKTENLQKKERMTLHCAAVKGNFSLSPQHPHSVQTLVPKRWWWERSMNLRENQSQQSPTQNRFCARRQILAMLDIRESVREEFEGVQVLTYNCKPKPQHHSQYTSYNYLQKTTFHCITTTE